MRKVAAAEIDRRVRDAAAKLEIGHLLNRRPSQLSGGQRQRVALGRAMVRQPAVFLMDEPLSNLDAALRISMRAEIKHLHNAMQTTFVYVTHDQAEALDACRPHRGDERWRHPADRQSPDDIYERPRNMFVASFLGNPADQLSAGHDRGNGASRCFGAAVCAIALPPRIAVSRAAREGQECVLGLRPEDVTTR